MNTSDVETRLKHAIAVATAPRCIVDDVMRQLPMSLPKPTPRPRWRRPVLVTSLAVPTVTAATLVFLLFTGPAVRLTLANIQAAVERQAWVHIRFDVGQFKESWTNLRTGEAYTTRSDGNVVYVNDQTNTRFWYWKNDGVIRQDTPTRYAPGKSPRPWTPRTAWEQIVAPLEHAVAATERADTSPPPFVSVKDTFKGRPVIRFDSYTTDSLGNRFLYAQLWADPDTHLPVRVSTRLQLADREAAGKEWSSGDYEFPATGPTDVYALGVPRGTPIAKEVTTATATVQTILDGINRAHDNFLKNYRAVIWTVRVGSVEPIDGLDIIWREGEKLRQDHHLPAFELQHNPALPPLPQPNPTALLKWATQSEAAVKQLMDSQREYSWRSAAVAETPKAHVHVIRHGKSPLLDTNAWPERIQWPTRYHRPDFHVLDTNVDTVAGCIGLRSSNGDSRSDYYIDPKNDYVCVKQVHWIKRGTEWAKTREYELFGLHRIADRAVAQGVSDSTETIGIDIVPYAATDYPPAIFDPISLTTGAHVDGY
jgi:hypothetical protein